MGLNLCRHINALGWCDTVIVVAGGPTIADKYRAEIVAALAANPAAALFQCNEHFSRLAWGDLRDMTRLKVNFAADFVIEHVQNKHYHDRWLPHFMMLPNAWSVLLDYEKSRPEVDRLKINSRVVWFADFLGDVFEHWDRWLEDDKSLTCRYGTLGQAVTAIPASIRDVRFYGVDSLTLGDLRSINAPGVIGRGYMDVAKFLQEYCRRHSDRWRITFHA